MTFRQIHVEIWDDPWFLDLNYTGKLLFIYLFSNKRTNLLGLYEVSRKAIAFETDLPLNVIDQTLGQFATDGKICIDDTWIWVPKLLTRNSNNLRSPKTQAHLVKLLEDTPDTCPFKRQWVEHYNHIVAPQYGINTISIGYSQSQIPSATATATAIVSDPVIEDTVSAVDTFVKLRGGAVNSLDAEQIGDLVDELEAHRANLPRGSPGAEQSGEEWVRTAILEANAARSENRLISLNYVKAILDRWRVQGYQAPRDGPASVTTKDGRTVIKVTS